jgi:hypothetical protein
LVSARGQIPSTEILITLLSKDQSPSVRLRAEYMMKMQSNADRAGV